jgi:hypothetical protein
MSGARLLDEAVARLGSTAPANGPGARGCPPRKLAELAGWLPDAAAKLDLAAARAEAARTGRSAVVAYRPDGPILGVLDADVPEWRFQVQGPVGRIEDGWITGHALSCTGIWDPRHHCPPGRRGADVGSVSPTADPTMLAAAVERTVLDGHDGRSGAQLERVQLNDGTRLVVKRTRPGADLTMQLSGDSEGRELCLCHRCARPAACRRGSPGRGRLA